MAIDTSSINTLINDFRALSQKDSISPESLGALLQRLADLLASCTSDTEAKPLQDLLNKISTLPDVVLSIANGADDLKNVLANISKGNILTGKVSSILNQILVRPASAEHAGAMTAQHVSDLTSAIATATKAKEDLSTLTQENAKDHAAIRKESAEARKNIADDLIGKDLNIGTLNCGDTDCSADMSIVGALEVGNGVTVNSSDITVAGGDIHVQGEAELGSVKTEDVQATGSIECNGKVSGQVIHGDSATFCQGNEVQIDVNGNISTEGTLTVKGVAALEDGATVGGELTCDGLTANSAEVNGKVMANSVEADGDIIAGGKVKTSEIIPGSGSGGVVEVDGQLVTKNWGVMAGGDSGVSGSLNVSKAVSADELYADSKIVLDKEDVGAMLVHIFHGIRQSLPTDYTAATLALTPKTRTDGVADIIYVREKKRFYAFWEEQKAYAERFDGEAEYNVITNNKPTTARTDRTWQWGADTYKYDTEAYISQYNGKGNDKYGADLVCITDAGKALFIKMWREAICRPLVGIAYNTAGNAWFGAADDFGNHPITDYGGYFPEWHETPGFYLNGLQLSYAEARQIYECRTYGPYPRRINTSGGVRTNLLCDYRYTQGGGNPGNGINTPAVFQSDDLVVVRVAAGQRGQRPPANTSAWLCGVNCFYDAAKLEEIIGAISVGTMGDTAINNVFSPFRAKMQYVWITGLSVSLTKTFAMASAINVDCLRYLVEKSNATAAKPISVTLHADVFAALPEDILTLAETKHVTFVSA